MYNKIPTEPKELVREMGITTTKYTRVKMKISITAPFDANWIQPGFLFSLAFCQMYKQYKLTI